MKTFCPNCNSANVRVLSLRLNMMICDSCREKFPVPAPKARSGVVAPRTYRQQIAFDTMMKAFK